MGSSSFNMFTKVPNFPKVHFISDPHFGHTNLTYGCSTWKDKSQCRRFSTEAEMSQAMIDGINKYVGVNDLLVGAGDFSFNGVQNIWNFRKQIVCKNIYWTYGNHDHHIYHNKELRIPYSELDLFKSLVFPMQYPSHWTYDSSETFSARPRDLFKSIDKELWLKINGKYYVIHHWPKRSWFNSQDGTILLYGHEHGMIEHTPWGLSIDIGMDNAFRLYGEYRPFSEEMIFEQLQYRTIYQHGHH